MLTDIDKDLVRECMDALRRGIAGFRPRRPQLEMVAAVANTLACCRQQPDEGGGGRGEHIAVIEAGTGTGKSFGALVPALVLARKLGKRLVVSSSTVALQHQYAEKDAPMLQSLLPLDFTFAVAKGRRRYACTARLMAAGTAAGQQDLLSDESRDEHSGLQGQVHSASPAATEATLRRQRRIVVGLAESFEAGRWNGDRDELAVPVADELWADLTTDRQGCSGNRCPDFARCPFQAARQRAKEADLVIANHDLVLSALDMEAGSVLPPASETFYVFDEAHCLSKWGHDFRTDYLYVSRFIREHFGAQRAPVACFTATAKPDVIDDLCEHFSEGLGLKLERFLGGHERENLSYLVVAASKAQKAQRIVELLRHELKDGGAAVVFCATRKTAQTMSELVTAAGTPCGCFHGGLESETKKDIQQRFMQGELAVIAATNAFGMGVDKPDIRVVIHADIPGSLENYLQEAGRAGRDGLAARCVLLFDQEDVETQFRLSATSQLTKKDFSSLLKAIRTRVRRLKSSEIVVSAKELLSESEGTTIDIDARDASTKVTTAIAWLERSGFLKRNENNSRVFPASLRVATLEEALKRIEAASLPVVMQQRYNAVAATLFRSLTPEGVSTDELMLDAGIQPEECFRILHKLEELGILVNDIGITVRISKNAQSSSSVALRNLDELERELLDLMSERAPDAELDGSPQHLTIRPLCTELRRRMGLAEGDARVSPRIVRKCLDSLSVNFGAGAERRSMMQVRGHGPDSMRVVLHRPWSQIRTICERRRATAQVMLSRLVAELPAGSRESSLIVECKSRNLIDAINGDLELRSNLTDPAAAVEHALLYMHDNGVVELDKGRSVFRSAMTIQTDPDALKRHFGVDEFAPLQEFYSERTLQTHVMHEYARLGAEKPDKARQLVDAYFSMPRRRFAREFFKGRADLLKLATTDESFRRIVDDLRHPVQQALVTMPEHGNHLVLAGPGSGKTRVIVHRIAYLLRVLRVSPERILALAFNRSAAVELRRRLIALVGDDARSVTVLTYHGMALRLTGISLAASDRRGGAVDFGRLLQDAIDLLEGQSDALSDADERRDSLLQGYEYIFVDEYQDIDAQQYALVSALAGRRLADPDAKLSIMAVGDDDQNIYSFRHACVEFIRRFQADYDGATTTYLVENFRSTQNIIAAANQVIQRAADRMKVDHPIRIDARRTAEPPGGRWSALDADQHGRVRLVTAPADPNRQAQVVFDEITRIRRVDAEASLGDIAVLARTHGSLDPLRALCEIEGVRYELLTRESAGTQVSLMHSREGCRTADVLRARRSALVSVAALRRWLARQSRRERENLYWQDMALPLKNVVHS